MNKNGKPLAESPGQPCEAYSTDPSTTIELLQKHYNVRVIGIYAHAFSVPVHMAFLFQNMAPSH